MKQQTNIEKALNIHGEDDNGVWIKSTRTLRQLIGVLGMLLPLFLFVFTPNCNNPLESISHYYYVRSGVFLIVVLTLIGIFLIIYTKNFMLSSLAGICALFVVFFPTNQPSDVCSITFIPYDKYRVVFHYVSAAIFLAILAFMSIVSFPKLDDEEKHIHKTKVKYKWLYKLSGFVMLIAILIIGLRFSDSYLPDVFDGFFKFYDKNNLTFWMEVVALEAFGISWLVRGRMSAKQSEVEAQKALSNS